MYSRSWAGKVVIDEGAGCGDQRRGMRSALLLPRDLKQEAGGCIGRPWID